MFRFTFAFAFAFVFGFKNFKTISNLKKDNLYHNKMSFELTTEQKKKLENLDEEMKNRKIYEETNKNRKEISAKEMGIPVDLIDLDVIKVGTILGLIKKKDSTQTGTLLDLIFPTKQKINLENIPKHYYNAYRFTTELDKIQYQQQYVQTQCDFFSHFCMLFIKQNINNLNSTMMIKLNKYTLDDYNSTLLDLFEVITEDLLSENINEIDQTEPDDWDNLKKIRNGLLGSINICQYKLQLEQNIRIFKQTNISNQNILNSLSIIDSRLSLYPGSLRDFNSKEIVEAEKTFQQEIKLRSFLRPPQLNIFNMNTVLQQCCIPSLIMVSITVVLEHGLIGPYQNNPIGFLTTVPAVKENWSYYVLKTITNDGLRLWVLDAKLKNLTYKLQNYLSIYLIKLFRTFYKTVYKTLIYNKQIFTSTQSDVFQNLLQNLEFVANYDMFQSFITQIIRQKSCLIATDQDYFNHLKYHDRGVPKNINFRNIIMQLFDEISESDVINLINIFNH